MAEVARPGASPLTTADRPAPQARSVKGQHGSLKTLVFKLSDAPSAKALIERPAAAIEADADHADVGSNVSDPLFRRSDQQLEKLRRAFWVHREEIARWERTRELDVRRTNQGLSCSWRPTMPKPEYERIALSSELGIFLPVASVRSFFKEYKRETRDFIKAGKLPEDFVRAAPCMSHDARESLLHI